MSPHHTRKKQKLYRYYVSQTVLKHGAGTCPVGRIPAERVESLVITKMREMLEATDFIVGTWRQAKKRDPDISEEYVRSSLSRFTEMWERLFPREQARILQLLVKRVDVYEDRCDIELRQDTHDILWSLDRNDPDIAAFV